MFEIGWTEILVCAIVAIVVFPSKDLPKLLRTTGQMIGRARRMAGEFQSQFNAALREAEREADLVETRKQIESIGDLNPVNQVRKALDPLRTAGEDIKRDLSSPGPTTRAASQLVTPTEPPSVATPETAVAAVKPEPVPLDVPVAPVEPAPAPSAAPPSEPPTATGAPR